MAKFNTHEGPANNFGEAEASDRSFGLVFAAFFGLVALWPLKSGGDIRMEALGASAAFLTAAIIAPKMLRPLNRLWFKLGMLLHHVVTPLVMGLLFFLTVTPIGILMRVSGKDPMRLKRNPGDTSYWLIRDHHGSASQSMKNQF